MNASARKAKIFLFTDSFPWGPGEKPFVIPEIEALNKSYEITIVSLAENGLAMQEEYISEVDDSIQVIRWERDPKWRKYARALSYPFSRSCHQEFAALMRDGITFKRLKESVSVYAEAKDLASFCEKRGLFDDVSHSIYYCFWFSLQCLAISLIKNQRKGLRLVSRAHRYDLFQDANPNNRQPWQRFMRDNCDRLLFLCDSAKEYFTREFGEEVFAGQYKVNGLGVRPSRQSPIRPPSQPPRIVSCSNVLSFKRVDLIAEALGSIPDKRIQWVHFGDGPEKDAIANEARQMQLNASFCGHVSNEDVREYYENNYVDAFVTATSSEGVPVSIQEALSCGIPIIGTDVGGISEQISGNGILLSANPSVESLAWAISEMCDAPLERREAMRNRSRSIWAEKYDLAKNKASLMQILSDLYNTSVN